MFAKEECYRIYGYSVKSSIELPGCRVGEEPQITVNIADSVHDSDFSMGEKWVFFYTDSIRVEVYGVAIFYIRDGKEIVICPVENADINQIKVFLLGVCFSLVLQQRRIVTIHGSCIWKDKKTMLICGTSGAGKSTLTAQFLKQGWKLISDDIVPLIKKEDGYYAQSSFPEQKMWQDTIDYNQVSKGIKGDFADDGTQKKYLIDASSFYKEGMVRLTHGVMLTHGVDELLFREINGFAKVDLLMRNRYIQRNISDDQMKELQLKTCIEAATQMRLFLAERPDGVHTEDQIMNLLLQEMETEK